MASGGQTSLEDSNRILERLVEQMQLLNVEKLKKINETSQSRIQTVAANGGNLTLGPSEIEALAHSIRTQTEQNQLLKRSYAELEKEFRNLTDSRIALEIKLDILNTSSLATPNIVSQSSGAGISTSVITTVSATSTGLQSPISLANANALANINTTPASTNASVPPQTPATIQGQQSGSSALAASNLATVVKSKTANMNLIHSTPISTLQTPLSAASGVLLTNQLAGNAPHAGNTNNSNLIAASAANQTNTTSSKLII